MNGRVIAVILGLLLVGSIFATFRLIRQKGETIERITAADARLTPEDDKSRNLTEIPRLNEWVYYRVMLKDVPLGEKLTMDCEWTDPSGQPVKQNHYETQAVTHDPWETHCRGRFGPDSAAGAWTVVMYVHRRAISRTSFTVNK